MIDREMLDKVRVIAMVSWRQPGVERAVRKLTSLGKFDARIRAIVALEDRGFALLAKNIQYSVQNHVIDPMKVWVNG